MKVLFITRPDLYTKRGGDTTQVENTAGELRKLGVEVDILKGKSSDYSKYDLLHLFNLVDCEDHLGPVLSSGLPYVISTIYVDYSEYDRYHRKDLLGRLSRILGYNQVEFLKTCAKVLLKGERLSSWRYFLKGHGGSIRFLLKNAACLLPNSESEYQRLLKAYGIPKEYIVVPNGADPFFAEEGENQERKYILSVARLEGIKNRLNLIRAMKSLDQKLLLVGPESVNQKEYVEQCKKEADKNVEFLPSADKEELRQYYRKAKVHVLPSWFETTGLVSLEAALAGCNIVVSDRGDVRDYFKDFVFYCDPADPASIRKAISDAYQAPANKALKQHILANFNWKKAAEKTLEAYTFVLNKRV